MEDERGMQRGHGRDRSEKMVGERERAPKVRAGSNGEGKEGVMEGNVQVDIDRDRLALEFSLSIRETQNP